jgi:predicted HD superfamily hydrolase involved in NAD metabolism
MEFQQMKDELKKHLKESRYRHSVGVSDTAVFLAGRFGVDESQARIAGLLHDCAREFSNDAMQAEADKRQISYGQVERRMPLLLHAGIGARLVKERYGVDDRAISQAIEHHTVGGAAMTRLDKIIYFADMIEPQRNYPGVDELRRLSRSASLDEMVLAGLSRSIIFVVQKGHLVHPDTVQARNEILLKVDR